MATKKQVVPAAKKTDLAALNAQLAEEAASAVANAIAKPSGRKLMVKNKQFQLPDGTVLGDSIDVVVVDFISMNRYYTEVFNPNNPQPPVCIAMGKDLNSMAPIDESPDKQAEACKSCPMNQWESDPRGGKGKACKNTRELAVILASDAGEDDAPIYTLSVSPTSIKSFDAMVLAVARQFEGPLVKAIINISTNPNTDFAQLVFSDPAINEDFAEHLARRPEAQDYLFVVPDFSALTAPKPAARTAARPNARGPARAR